MVARILTVEPFSKEFHRFDHSITPEFILSHVDLIN